MDAKLTASQNDGSASGDIAFLSASTLAAAGRLEEAQSTLCPGGQLPASPPALDLLARIALQSGNVEQARRLWHAASQASPAYEPATKALNSLGSPWFAVAAAKRLVVLLMLSLMACLAVVGVLALFRQLPQPVQPRLIVENRPVRLAPHATAPEPAKPAAPVAPSPDTDTSEALKRLAQSYEQRAGQLETQLQTLQRKQEDVLAEHYKLLKLAIAIASSNQVLNVQQQAVLNLAERTQREIHDLSEAYANDRRPTPPSIPRDAVLPSFVIADDNVTVTLDGNGWEVRFKSALFDRDDHLKIGAKSQIESVAKAIVRTQAKVHMQVVGYANNEPPTWPWATPISDAHLGQLRAEKIKATLARMALFPATALSATNGASGNLPYPGDNRRNRTVVLRISQTH
jgi:hypothetical protein